ncbi:iron permease, partial [Escherichia coli]|nr:iron permease [Escherichia coli]
FELVESSLDNVDADLRRSTEKQLMSYRQALRDGLPETQVAQQLELATGKLAEAAKQLGGDSLSFSISFVSALLILLREGVEAILV